MSEVEAKTKNSIMIYEYCQEKLDAINTVSKDIGLDGEFDIVYQKFFGEYQYGLIRHIKYIKYQIIIFTSPSILEFDSMLHSFLQAWAIIREFKCV